MDLVADIGPGVIVGVLANSYRALNGYLSERSAKGESFDLGKAFTTVVDGAVIGGLIGFAVKEPWAVASMTFVGQVSAETAWKMYKGKV